MDNVNEILARLQKGESAEDIANEFANVVNEAVRLNDVQNKEKQKAAQKEAELDKYAQDIADAMRNYITLQSPEAAALLAEDDDSFTGVPEIRKMLDTSVKTVLLAAKITAKLSEAPSLTDKTPSDPISQFLKDFGLLN